MWRRLHSIASRGSCSGGGGGNGEQTRVLRWPPSPSGVSSSRACASREPMTFTQRNLSIMGKIRRHTRIKPVDGAAARVGNGGGWRRGNGEEAGVVGSSGDGDRGFPGKQPSSGHFSTRRGTERVQDRPGWQGRGAARADGRVMDRETYERVVKERLDALERKHTDEEDEAKELMASEDWALYDTELCWRVRRIHRRYLWNDQLTADTVKECHGRVHETVEEAQVRHGEVNAYMEDKQVLLQGLQQQLGVITVMLDALKQVEAVMLEGLRAELVAELKVRNDERASGRTLSASGRYVKGYLTTNSDVTGSGTMKVGEDLVVTGGAGGLAEGTTRSATETAGADGISSEMAVVENGGRESGKIRESVVDVDGTVGMAEPQNVRDLPAEQPNLESGDEALALRPPLEYTPGTADDPEMVAWVSADETGYYRPDPLHYDPAYGPSEKWWAVCDMDHVVTSRARELYREGVWDNGREARPADQKSEARRQESNESVGRQLVVLQDMGPSGFLLRLTDTHIEFSRDGGRWQRLAGGRFDTDLAQSHAPAVVHDMPSPLLVQACLRDAGDFLIKHRVDKLNLKRRTKRAMRLAQYTGSSIEKARAELDDPQRRDEPPKRNASLDNETITFDKAPARGEPRSERAKGKRSKWKKKKMLRDDHDRPAQRRSGRW